MLPTEQMELRTPHAAPPRPGPESVRDQLQRIGQSPLFSKSPRLAKFLSFTVEQTLLGNHERLKEYLIGVEVFTRPDTFDPRLDSIVRVEARRLRDKVERYYATLGLQDDVLITYRRGEYVPQFIMRPRLWTDSPDASDEMPKVLLALPDREEALRWGHELNGAGYQLAGLVHSGRQMADALGSMPADVVVTDADFCQPAYVESDQLRDHNSALVLVTSQVGPEFLHTLMETGAAGYLLRPARIGEFGVLVSWALARRKRAQLADGLAALDLTVAAAR